MDKLFKIYNSEGGLMDKDVRVSNKRVYNSTELQSLGGGREIMREEWPPEVSFEAKGVFIPHEKYKIVDQETGDFGIVLVTQSAVDSGKSYVKGVGIPSEQS